MKTIYKISLSLIILVGIIAISLPSLLTLAGLHPKFNGDTFNLDGKKALIIATNHGVLNKPGETSGKPTGLFLSELSIPYYDFKKSKIQVEIASIKGGNIPREYIPSVEKGFKDSMKNGPLAGFEVDSMKVTLKDGSFHPVDSDSLSFELAAKLAFKTAAKAAILLFSRHPNS